MRLLQQLWNVLVPGRSAGVVTTSWSFMVLAQVDLTPDPSEIDSSWMEGLSPAGQRVLELVFEVLQWASVAVLAFTLVYAFIQYLGRNTHKATDALKWAFTAAVIGILVWTPLGLTIIDGVVNVVTSGA